MDSALVYRRAENIADDRGDSDAGGKMIASKSEDGQASCGLILPAAGVGRLVWGYPAA